MRFVRLLLLVSVINLIACGDNSERSDVVKADPETVSPAIDMVRFRRDVETLSSDAFGGRAPSSEGERLTVE